MSSLGAECTNAESAQREAIDLSNMKGATMGGRKEDDATGGIGIFMGVREERLSTLNSAEEQRRLFSDDLD